MTDPSSTPSKPEDDSSRLSSMKTDETLRRSITSKKDLANSSSSSTSSSSSSSSSIRTAVGHGMITFGDFVNQHLPEVRTATTITIGLVAAYGILQTPLFFRYRTVAELPSTLFRQRQTLRGRLVKVWVKEHVSCQARNINQSTTTVSKFKSQASSSSTSSWRDNRDKLFAFPPEEEDRNNQQDDDWETIDERSSSSSSSTPNNRISTAAIYCAIRHASPVEAWLSKTWYNRLMQWYPSVSMTSPTSTTSTTNSTDHQRRRLDEQPDQLLIVQLAGVQSLSQQQQQQSLSSSSSSSSLLASMNVDMVQGASTGRSTPPQTSYNTTTNTANTIMPPELEWLQLLAKERPLISCQLLARRVPVLSKNTSNSSQQNNSKTSHLFGDAAPVTGLRKRPIPGMERRMDEDSSSTTNSLSSSSSDTTAPKDDDSSSEGGPSQIAIGKLFYRPPPSSLWNGLWQLAFPSDVALSLVQMGRASVASDGLLITSSSTSPSAPIYRIEDTTESVRDLQRDVQYMEGLQKAEYQAVAEQRGLWQQPTFRTLRADVVQEVEFQTTAPWYAKVWRWMRGG